MKHIWFNFFDDVVQRLSDVIIEMRRRRREGRKSRIFILGRRRLRTWIVREFARLARKPGRKTFLGVPCQIQRRENDTNVILKFSNSEFRKAKICIPQIEPLETKAEHGLGAKVDHDPRLQVLMERLMARAYSHPHLLIHNILRRDLDHKDAQKVARIMDKELAVVPKSLVGKRKTMIRGVKGGCRE